MKYSLLAAWLMYTSLSFESLITFFHPLHCSLFPPPPLPAQEEEGRRKEILYTVQLVSGTGTTRH